MLGWEFRIYEQSGGVGLEAKPKEPTLARWMAGLGGTDWIDALATKGVAKDLGGNGYPNRYLVPAGALVQVLAEGVPVSSGPPVVGDDYFLPGGWVGEVKMDLESLRALGPFTVLLVEAWDQS